MGITAFDHVAIPIGNVDAMLSFYRRLGFDVREEDAPFYSVHFGDQKINFHGPEVWQSQSVILRGVTATPGCGDLCFVWEGSKQSLAAALTHAGAEVVDGPVERLGGRNKGRTKAMSTYIRDPDSNLLEFIIYP